MKDQAAKLRDAIEAVAVARGEVLWTNGYRTALKGRDAEAEDGRMYEKEQRQHAHCERVEKRLEQVLSAFMRAVSHPVRRRGTRARKSSGVSTRAKK